jgi:hypothetical protein
MKQVKCVVFVRKVDGKVGAITETHKPGDDDLDGDWTAVEMTGEMPEAEKTCEVRWDGDNWGIWMPHALTAWRLYKDLRAALTSAIDTGWRVTNDPREVVLRPAVSPLRGWVLVDGTRTTCPFEPLESAREYAQQRGWRILSEEPAQRTLRCSFCGKSNKDVKFLFTDTASAICDECLAVCNRAKAERLERKEPAEQKPTLGELLGAWRTGPRNNWDHLHLDALLGRIVDAIGRDKR